MKKLSADALNDNKHVIADFVCPTEKKPEPILTQTLLFG